ncbi:MAG: hypothetical protein ACYTF9_00035 [Planctomycetota bacterium]|jgi:hypothetical protein
MRDFLRGSRCVHPRLAVLPLVALLLLAAGCSSAKGPAVLAIEPENYLVAFDTAIAVADEHGLVTAVRDRRSGVIETRPADPPTLIDPWAANGETFGQLSENTISQQRRRARFEFSTAGFDTDGDPASRLSGPDLLAEDDPPDDLTDSERPIELRVWVYVDRIHHPGSRRGTWTFSKNLSSSIVVTEAGERRTLTPTWTTVTRDEDLERRLLAEVEKRMLPRGRTERDDREPS